MPALMSLFNYRCEAYVSQNCTVYATARRLESMSNLNHPNIHKLRLDVLEEEQAREVVKAIITKEGRIDILVNNAGSGAPGKTSNYVPLYLMRITVARPNS